MNNKVKQQIFLKISVLLLLFLPLFFQVTRIKKFSTLNGVQVTKSQFLFDSLHGKLSWIKGSKQKYYDLKATEDLVLKAPLTKLKNQIEFSLFRKINSREIYLHKNNLFRFYDENYNETYLFLGKQKIKDQVDKLNEIQSFIGDSIPIITMIAPSKMHLYQNDLPAINRLKSQESNYYQISTALKKRKLHLIDFNVYFKNFQSKFPIIGKGGIHWSSYGSCLAMDSFVNYLSTIKKIKFQKSSWKINPNYSMNYADQDLAQLLNLFFPPNDTRLRNVIFSETKNTRRKIKALIISDSFFDVISETKLRNQIFTKDSKYYYYFKSEKSPNRDKKSITKSHLLKNIFQVDCVIIMSNITNLENFSWGFIDEVYKQIQN